MKKAIFIIFALIVISCNLKKDDIKRDKKVEDITADVSPQDEFNTELFKVDNTYHENSYNFIELLINYNLGKFVYNEEFEKYLVDTFS